MKKLMHTYNWAVDGDELWYEFVDEEGKLYYQVYKLPEPYIADENGRYVEEEVELDY